MARNGLLIQYDWCTGCHACEIACKQEHDFPVGLCGIKVEEIIMKGPDKVSVDYGVNVTRYCDLCTSRVKDGQEPSCVKHCQSRCITYGTLAELAKLQETQPGSSLHTPF